MKESILTRVTRIPLARPTSAPISNTAMTAPHHGSPCPCNPIASTCEMPRLNPADRSKWLAVIGMNTASATSACTDLLLRIDLMLNSVGNVSGLSNENTINSRISRTSSPRSRSRA